MAQNVEDAVREVSLALGVQLGLSREPAGAQFDYKIRLAAISEGKGMSLFVRHGFLQWSFSLFLEDYASPLLSLLKRRFSERKDELNTLLAHARAFSHHFEFQGDVLEKQESTPGAWADFNFSAVYEYGRHDDPFQALIEPLLAALSVPLCLLEESSEWIDASYEGEFEGELLLQQSRSYERSRYNRAICLRHYGFSCRGCGMEMSESYGPLSSEVIEVHHIVPVSLMSQPKRLDPIRDLVPLCPNCHKVIHTESPPLTVLELRDKTGFSSDDLYQYSVP